MVEIAEPALAHCALSVSALRSRLRVQEEYRRAAEEAEAARRTTDLLLARVGHAFRTPLVALAGIAELLEQRGQGMAVERWQEAYRLIRQNGERLSALVDKLITVARIRAGRRPLTCTPLDFDAIAETAAFSLAGLLAGRPVDYHIHRAPDLPEHLVSDQEAILEILDNLLGNAAKFTKEGRVSLAIMPESPSRVVFAVRDTGIGIDGSILAAMREPFHTTSTGQGGERGSGLGLAIVAGLTEQLGASLTFLPLEDGGTEVRCVIPDIGRGAQCFDQ